ncbi:MAG: ParA family protein [Burkholderiales bacterium]
MHSILVVNPKGGSGKTTVATNLAGLFAARRYRVALADMDRQLSAAGWLKRRPETLPIIIPWTAQTDKKNIKSLDPQWAIIDSPAGVHGEKLTNLVRRADLIVVPVAPSAFDMEATKDFMLALRDEKPVRKGESPVAVVGNRVDSRTIVAIELEEFLKSLQLPILSYLRDTQNYIHCARNGYSLFDYAPSRVEQDLQQWRPIARWLQRQVQPLNAAK